MEEILVPLVFFGFLGSVILGPIYLKERTKQSAHKLISQALEKGQALDPKVMEDLMRSSPPAPPPQDRARRTLGSAIIMLALAGGFAAAGALSGSFDPSGFAFGGIMIPAVILGSLGAGFLILALVDFGTKKKTDV